jgi:hypothetical protein
VFIARDIPGRVLRVSAHPENGRVVLSISQDARCLATLRLAPEDVPEVLRSLGSALVACEVASVPGHEDGSHPLAS